MHNTLMGRVFREDLKYMSLFTLINAKGEQVDILNDGLLAYQPTGLGVQFNNTYSQYENYFKNTKSQVAQGQMAINILFGDVESVSYQTFSQFASFLNYEPLTLVYSTDSGTWNRDARVGSLTKSEIGGTTVLQTDRLVEAFTLEFINPWYNNKEGKYKSYDADPNLALYGKGYFNEMYDYENMNILLNSNFAIGFTGWSNENNRWVVDSGSFNGNSIVKSPTTVGGGSRLIQDLKGDIPTSGTKVTISFYAKATKAGDIVTVTLYNGAVYTVALTSSWAFYSVSTTIPSNFSTPRVYFWNNTAGDNVWLNSTKMELGTVATEWKLNPSEQTSTWNYGYQEFIN